MKTITRKEAEYMIRGASILSCGGGLPFLEQMEYLKQLPIERGLSLIDIDELSGDSPEDVFVTASELGPSGDPPIDKTKVPLMLNLFRQKCHKNIKGIIPVEIGQESIVFDAALRSGLPIINTDLVGMRAVPKASYNALRAQNVPFTRSPLVVLTNKGEIIFVKKNKTLLEDEVQLRSIAKKTQGVIFVMGGFISACMIKKYLNHPSLSTVLAIGEKLIKNKNFLSSVPLPLLFSASGIIRSVEKIENPGFTEKKVVLSSRSDLYTLTVKNEYMRVTNGDVTYAFPHLITFVDERKKRGLASSEIKKGMAVTLYVFKPLPFWENFRITDEG